MVQPIEVTSGTENEVSEKENAQETIKTDNEQKNESPEEKK